MTYIVVVGAHRYEVAVDDAGSLQVELDGRRHTMGIFPWLGTTHFRVQIDGTPYRVVIRRAEDHMLVSIGEDRYRIAVARKLPVARSASRRPTGSGRHDIKAPMPGLIVTVEVTPGERIEAGRAVAIMEAMKMQMEIRAPRGGRVLAVNVQPGQEVAGGTVLVSLGEPT